MPPRARLGLVQVSLPTWLGAFLDLEDVAFSVTEIASATASLKVLFDLDDLAAGRSNKAIASELAVTLDTVEKHVSHLLAKLGAANRTKASR